MNQNIEKIKDHPLAGRVATEIESQLTQLQGMNEELLKRCHSLKERLASVLRGLDRKEPAASPREALVPLAETLRGIGDGMTDAIEMLEDIERGIELPN